MENEPIGGGKLGFMELAPVGGGNLGFMALALRTEE
jgi:hypothetical protein